MSIWIDGELAPHSYEKTLVGINGNTIVWIEGTNIELSFHRPNAFGICGGNINTNDGMGFTKNQLLEIANNMKEGAIMKVCGCNWLNKEGVIKDFKHDNNMVKCGPSSFKPKN